jgi:amino acid permease
MKRFASLTFGIYALYLVKSAVGINISPNYSMPWWVKLPIAPIMAARDANYWPH